MNVELVLNEVLDPSRQVLVFYNNVGFIHDTVRMVGVSSVRCVAILKSNVRSMLAFHPHPQPTPNTSTVSIFFYNDPAGPKYI
jgi:hypothetical protein